MTVRGLIPSEDHACPPEALLSTVSAARTTHACCRRGGDADIADGRSITAGRYRLGPAATLAHRLCTHTSRAHFVPNWLTALISLHEELSVHRRLRHPLGGFSRRGSRGVPDLGQVDEGRLGRRLDERGEGSRHGARVLVRHQSQVVLGTLSRPGQLLVAARVGADA